MDYELILCIILVVIIWLIYTHQKSSDSGKLPGNIAVDYKVNQPVQVSGSSPVAAPTSVTPPSSSQTAAPTPPASGEVTATTTAAGPSVPVVGSASTSSSTPSPPAAAEATIAPSSTGTGASLALEPTYQYYAYKGYDGAILKQYNIPYPSIPQLQYNCSHVPECKGVYYRPGKSMVYLTSSSPNSWYSWTGSQNGAGFYLKQ